MLSKFKNSVLGNRINHNSASVSLLASNLYNKIKVKGILPDYVERERTIDYFNVSHLGPTVEDTDFTFEQCITGEVVLAAPLNIGRVHTIEYERKFVASTVLEYYINAGNKVTFPSVSDGFQKIKFVRNHLEVSMYSDSVLVGSGNLSADEDMILTDSLINTTDKFANYKITSQGKILHWWKFNFIIPSGVYDELHSIFASDELMYNDYVLILDYFILPAEEGMFLDEGYNDEDFYSLWYPIAFVFASIISYSQSILDVKGNIDIVKLFLSSKGVITNNNTIDSDITTIYKGWIDEFKKRGTSQIADRKNLVSGSAKKLLPFYELRRIGASTFDTAGSVTIKFKCRLPIYVSFRMFNNLEILKDGNDYTFTYSHYDSTDLVVNDQVQFTRVTPLFTDNFSEEVLDFNFNVSPLGHLVILINDEFIAELGIDIDSVLTGTTQTAVEVLASSTIIIANLEYRPYNLGHYIYPLTCEGTIICSDINRDPLNDLIIISNELPIVAVYPVDISYFDDSLDHGQFNNVEVGEFDGELLRLLYNRAYDENIYALIGNMELGQVNGTSYQNSSQTYPIINLNKFYNKNKLFRSLSGIPLTLGLPDRETFLNNNGVIEITALPATWAGINAEAAYVTFTKYIIQLNQSIDYEFSFRFKTTNAVDFRFGGIFLDNNNTEITNIRDGVTGNSLETNKVYIANESAFSLAIGRWVWVRGVIQKKTAINFATNKTNIGVGKNLIMSSQTFGFLPALEFQSVGEETVSVMDVQIRPLTLPMLKGYFGTKNIMVNYLKNNSGRTTEFIEREISDKLAPYNVSIKNKIL